ncbi:MAG: helix-turn-helix transcriptional regulator, partial [Rikenellaceae bacterium]
GSPDKPSCTITSQDTQVVLAILTRVERNMLRTGHRFFRETISLSVIEALLELINIVVGKRDDLNTSERSLRRDELCHTFMNLLSEHGKREHSVAFYADKMCITSQYLTKVLKKELGMSANKLIDVNLVGEATKLLRVSGISIGDIADQLNFSDQASFSKFFRKHTNQTPAKFRKMGKGRH